MARELRQEHGKNWSMFEGDCCQLIKQIPDNSIDICVHSPPFANLYIYGDSPADMGNCEDLPEFMRHYSFLIRELLRVTIPGRLCLVHCKDLPKYANRDDTAGLIDFPGEIIRTFIECGWSFHTRVTIWKCPVTERERTNNNGLLHKTIERDSSQVRQGMADYVIGFRKIPDGTLMSDKPIERPDGLTEEYRGDVDFRDNFSHPSKFARKNNATRESIDKWRRLAEPVWWDIDQTDVLNYEVAKGDKDERHICPLQIGLIRRCVQLWSAPGEVLLSPFAGIGSEGVGALREGRKFIGFELKDTYFDRACTELRIEEEKSRQKSLSFE